MTDYADLDELVSDADVDPEFDAAAEYLKQHHDKFLPDDLLELYGLFKQGTVGDCNTSKPGIFQIQGRAKWNAWSQLKGTQQSNARQQYIATLTNIIPSWRTIQSQSGPAVSRPMPLDETASTIADMVKENSPTFVSILATLKEEVNELDESGLGLIHWCADRGHVETLQQLLQHPHINVNLRDTDGQTALHYASSCGHQECLAALVAAGADKNTVDDEGNSIEMVAFDENMRQFIQNL